jgi:pimeloyl-ACP methyl ester carboxylesterase
MRLEVVSYVPHTLAYQTPILFLHGAWHGAWCWEDYFLPYFADKGFSAHSMSLRGHGKSEGRKDLRWFSVNDYVTDLLQVVRSLPEPPIIVAHSFGAFILQKYLEHYDTPAAVLVAPAPARGGVSYTLRAARSMPGSLLRTTFTFSPYHLVGSVERAHALFFSSTVPRADVEKHFARLQDDSFRAYLDFMGFGLPDTNIIRTRNIPMLILAAEQDRIFPTREIQALGALYNSEVQVLPNTAHDVMLEPTWQDTADRILAWVEKSGIA